ncbi:glutamine-hydrolyzing carbamoyl-phosphate synthase small subunit [Candidatus Ichthyocystis hellenicum]|uniref:glutamine-hydrolyzing carbamoyl-phosphate synthase small subunit n=1 Tax=Candidatus Ichthyocystis hellenicum TaxID=1561003 RepID=UPI000AC94CD1|nr:glutamine-hydrolyzing carbamoyl-phosphate synthase small subunit [Candidatus Ichthyocystis hellenicum]
MVRFNTRVPSVLVLALGEHFLGYSCGCSGSAVGEVIFNTAMTGYQEIITDPSYSNQMVVFTTPHVGSTGVNLWDDESDRSHLAGIIVRDLVDYPSNWQSSSSLEQFLCSQNIVGIQSIDTRALTILLRNNGSQFGCIYSGDDAHHQARISDCLSKAKEFKGLVGVDLVKSVTCRSPFHWNNHPLCRFKGVKVDYRVVVLDFGVKRSVLNALVYSGCDVTVLPAGSSKGEILSYRPDGIVLSNGPGDPAGCHEIILLTKSLMLTGIPLFGVCLGHQIIALANGLNVVKMPFGHHGVNHPVQDVVTRKVFISSQNHCFVVDEESVRLSSCCDVTHRSLFDQSIQGLSYRGFPGISFQGHPEGGGGPQDLLCLFDKFALMMGNCRGRLSNATSS